MIFEGLSYKHLAAFRIGLLGFWWIEVMRSDISALSVFDPGWFKPHGLWLLIPAAVRKYLISSLALQVLRWATASSLALALVGLLRGALWRALPLLLLLSFLTFLRGFGHPDHSHVQAYLVTVVLCFSPAWTCWSLRPEAEPRAQGSVAAGPVTCAFAAMALVFSLPYMATGVYRWAKEGLLIYFDTSMFHFIARDSRVLGYFDSSLGLSIVEHPAWLPFINLSFFMVTLAELTAPWAHLSSRACAMYLAVLLPFHLLSPLLMHVFFLPNVVVLVGLDRKSVV